jgi:hypothetical protein
MPVPRIPRATTAATGPSPGVSAGAVAIAAGASSTVEATITQAAMPVGGTSASRCFAMKAPTA